MIRFSLRQWLARASFDRQDRGRRRHLATRRPARGFEAHRFERLEDRRLLSINAWINPAGGNWNNPANWSGGIPGAGDDAVINTAAAATITIQSADAESVHSLTTSGNDTLSITGGSLTVAANSTLSGPLTMTGGSLTATGGGVTVSASGTSTVSSANLYATLGATLSLPGLTSYNSGGVFEATGNGSALNLSNLTTAQGHGWNIDALSGGEINLTGLTSLTGIGANNTLIDIGGSKVLDPNVTSLSGFGDNPGVTLDGTDAHVADSWKSFTGGNFVITGGGSYTLPGLTDVDGSNLYAGSNQGPGSLSLPGLTSFNGVGQFEAKGTGSVLDVSHLTTAQGHGWNIDALSGGEINLTGMTSLTGIGANNTLIDTGGSKILDPNVTSLSDFGDNPGVTLDGTDTHVADSWKSLTGGSLVITGGGSYTLPGLTDVDSSNLFAGSNQGPGSLSLPGLTSFNGVGQFEADGTGSVLDVSHLTTVQGHGWNIDALSGGEINLTGMTSLTGIGANNNLIDTGGSKILDPNVTSVSDFGGNPGVTLDGTDAHVADFWQSFSGALDITGGSYTLPSLINVTFSSLQLSGGASLSLPIVAAGSIPILNGQSITIRGTLVSLPASGASGATVNLPAAPSTLTIDLLNSGTLTGGTTLNVGAGTMVDLAGGTYTGGVTFNVGAGATVDLTGGQAVTYSGTLTGAGAGTVKFSGGTVVVAPGGLTLNFPGGMFQWTGGSFFASAGDVTNLGSLNLAGANLTISGNFSNSGNVTIDAGAIVNVAGNYTQTGASTLSVQLGGAPASGQFGQAAVSGTAALAGNFDLALVNGFTPTAGLDYRVATFASASGAFAKFSGLPAGMTATQSATALDLAIPLIAAAPTANADTFVLSQSATSGGSGATSVLANDTSADGQPQNLTATLVSKTTHGSLTLHADGSFSYTPDASFAGIDRFTYQVHEGAAVGNTVGVTLLSGHSGLVDKLYQQVLHRSAEDGGLAYWTNLLEHGASLDVVAAGIFNSVERLDPLVTNFYEKFLHRGTDPGGLIYWVTDWQRNGGPDHVVVNILASKEFFDDGGDTNNGYVTLLYQRFLGRDPEPGGFGFWTGKLNSGQLTTGQVAADFQTTHEQHVNLVDFLYGEYFNGATPTSAQAQPYIANLDAGQTETQIEVEIIDSPDYANTPPAPAPGAVGRALYPH